MKPSPWVVDELRQLDSKKSSLHSGSVRTFARSRRPPAKMRVTLQKGNHELHRVQLKQTLTPRYTFVKLSDICLALYPLDRITGIDGAAYELRNSL